MISFPIAFLGILAGTLIPAYFGIFVAVTAGRSRPQYLAAFAIGIFLWFFSDTIGDSSYLGVNDGLSGGLGHVALVTLFGFGLIAFFLIEGPAVASKGGSDKSQALLPSLAIPFLIAVALSIHGLGEGADFGSAASTTSSTSLIDAFGGYGPALSYSLHKVLEPIAIGASFSAFYLNRSGTTERARLPWKNLAIAGVVFAIPTLIGTTVGYYISFDTTYLFALGAGAAVYVFFKLAQAVFERSNPLLSYRESLRIALFALLGFVLIYSAAIFHSVVI